MWYEWDPVWKLPVLLAVSFLGKPIAGIAVAASVSAIAAAATGEVVGIRKSVFTGVGVGVVVNILIGATTAAVGYGFNLNYYLYTAGYSDFITTLASALAFYTAPAVIAAAVIWAMARRPNAGFSTLRECLLVGGSAGLILLAVGAVGDRMASFFASFIVVIAAALIEPSIIAIVVGMAAALVAPPFIVVIVVVIAAALVVRIIRARRAGDGGGSGVAR